MCGIAGIFNVHHDAELPAGALERMIAALRHRGPDGTGFYRDNRAGLAHARLSIIDLEGGRQPLSNEDGTVWITFNGEIFNYRELRRSLEEKGHRFATNSDTEVIVHLYEDHEADCLRHLNGQFAFAIWDRRQESLFLARDRVGIRPLFHTCINGSFLFASEVKALFMDPRVARELDPAGLDQIFTFWTTVPPRTVFRNVQELPAGHYMRIRNGVKEIRKYWDPDFTPGETVRTEEDYAEELKSLLIDATRLQLRADVPVGAYLSGGIDSSVITTLIRTFTETPLRTFSVTFPEKGFDESPYQRQMIGFLDAEHSAVHCRTSDIGAVFPDVIWHTEKPVIRTAPAPMYLLARLVRENGYKVVLTGEGSDEILAGYDLFKEVKVRQFIERCPGSTRRSLILKRLYPYLDHSPVRSVKYAEAFFGGNQGGYSGAYASHAPRWSTTSRISAFYSDGMKEHVCEKDRTDALDLHLSGGAGRDSLAQAQYIEMKLLLSGYLLSSQGDRMAMAHSIEGRFPFLDHRLIGFCCRLPANLKMRALTEKYLLKKCMSGLVPAAILARTKQPYRAPDVESFMGNGPPDYVRDLLSEGRLLADGYFDPRPVASLLRKCRDHAAVGFKDSMALVGIVSTQLVHDQFVRNFSARSGTAAERMREGAYHAGKV